ncbi:hypothetical protein CVD28_13665 [Bacillus sp. M6-12]|uniref:hypothetical protein n=1 Tax=Bacillus sp. M6-12 TaxID=2054166 RepID=UPI000C75B7E9|nr:hypothetical protein [Bacillus sp. M6-12]PLS17097.1 hypothetical protein CVD28_13665 [Bacillus sp. M6-12]
MKFAIALVVIIMLVAVVLTLSVAGKSDSDYRNSTKKNIKNLSIIYAVVIILSLFAVGVYFKSFY